MAFKEVLVKDLRENPFTVLSDEWMLVSAGNESGFNMMTASWGYFGHMWNKNTAVTVLRPQRYTKEFVDKNDCFALSFYGGDKKIHGVCGSVSGRDTDKAASTGLIPVFSDGTVYFEQARLVFICKKIYAQRFEPACFIDSSIDGEFYPEKDYHIAYAGEIIKAYEKI